MTFTRSTLSRVTNQCIGLRDALTIFGAFAADENVMGLFSSEQHVAVCAPSQLSSSDHDSIFEAEVWTGAASLRWIATGAVGPFTGVATVLTEAAESTMSAPSWFLETIACEARSTQYACWGDVISANGDWLVVGDDARRFEIVGDPVAAAKGDRLSLVGVEYSRSDSWGNTAVFDERISGIVIAERAPR